MSLSSFLGVETPPGSGLRELLGQKGGRHGSRSKEAEQGQVPPRGVSLSPGGSRRMGDLPYNW